MRRRLAVWGLVWLGWTSLAVFFAFGLWLNYVALGQEARFSTALIVSLTEWWIWALLTPIPVLLARRWPVAPPRRGRDLLRHSIAGLVVASLKVTLERGARTWIFGAAPYTLPSNLTFHWLVYCAVVGLSLAAAYYRRVRARELEVARIEAKLQEARVELLTAKLHPHFLFNALNTIAETIHEDPDRADRMVSSLSDLLRAALNAEGPTAPLAEELTLARHYLAIQQLRFGDRLRVTWDVDTGLDEWPLPRLLLQPLIENAVRHGVSTRTAGGNVAIGVREVAGSLEIVIADDGRGFGTDGPERDGVGLSNARARLDAIYGDRASLTIRNADSGGAVVAVAIPRPSQ